MKSSTAASDITALMISSRPAFGSRNSGSSDGPSKSSRIITGTPARKTEPHQKYWISNPPTNGPMIAPTE